MIPNATALCAAAESALSAGQGEQARALLEQALAAADSPELRTQVHCQRGRLALVQGNGPDLIAELAAEADALEAERPMLAAQLLAEVVILMLYARRPEVVEVAERAHSLAAQSGDRVACARADAVLGLAYALFGRADEAGTYLARSTELIRISGAPQQAVHLLQHVVIGLSAIERYTESMALCRQYVAAVRGVGAAGALPMMLCLLSNTAYFTSEFDVMEMAATEALGLAAGAAQLPIVVFANACLGLVLAVRGEYGTSREHTKAARAAIPATGMQTFIGMTRVADGVLALGNGEWDEACTQYGELHKYLTQTGEVSGIIHWRADEIEALLRAGRRELAAQRYAELTTTLESEGPWERASAARVGALLAPPDRAEALFERALELHRGSPAVFERARTELCWGEWLLEQGRPAEALAKLAAARDTFTHLGARPWTEKAVRLQDAASGAAEHGPAVQVATGTTGSSAADLELRAFGPLRLVRGGVETRIGMDTPGTALCYLVAAGGAAHAEQLIDALWPDAPPDSGASRLRTVLSRTRARYGPLLVRDGSVIRWSDGLRVDAHRFTELAKQALSRPRDSRTVRLAREAVDLYTADLIPMARYADWAVTARERMRQRYLALLELLTDDAAARGELQTAIEYAWRCVDTAPLDEDAYVRVIRLLIEAQRWSQAREMITRAKAAVNELGLPVSASVRSLEERLGTAQPSSQSSSQPQIGA